MSDAAHWPYGGGATGQPVPMQDGEIDLAACLPPPFGQTNAQGRGVPRVIVVNTPLVGHDWSYVHSGPSWFIPVCILARLATSAVVATRVPALFITFRSVQCASFPAATGVPASTTTVFSFSDAGSSVPNAGFAGVGTADNIMIADGMTLSTITTALDVGDQWSTIAILCEEFTDFDWS